MSTAITGSGLVNEYSVEVRKADGTLRYQESSVHLPELPPPPTPPASADCVDLYRKKYRIWLDYCKEKMDFYDALRNYHSARCAYCMRHRNDEIEEKYRTGEPPPQTIEETKREIRKLRR